MQGAGVVVQRGKWPLGVTTSECLIQVLATQILIQLPGKVPWKATDGGPSPWVPATHVENLNEVVGYWLLPGLALAYW